MVLHHRHKPGDWREGGSYTTMRTLGKNDDGCVLAGSRVCNCFADQGGTLCFIGDEAKRVQKSRWMVV